MPIRVVLAEDNLLVREGVRRLLETRKDATIEVVASCGDLDSLLVAVEAHQPDVVLTDIRMPPTHTDEGLLEEGSAGRAYLLKERVSDPEQLVGAIREVARGGSIIDPKVVETLVAALGELVPERGPAPTAEFRARTAHGAGRAEPLTARELEILGLVAKGASNQEIARQ